jgi:hypothetical protein
MNKKYVKLLKELKGHDPEIEHQLADKYLCELLKKLGYADVVSAFESLIKWYA